MKFSRILLIIFIVFSLFFIDNIFAQKGFKHCAKNLIEDYDFRAQSSYAWLEPGDTAYVKVVLYSGQEYRIFVCGSPRLGEINYRIIEEIKQRDRILKDVIQGDTIWIYETKTDIEIIYNNKSSSGEAWETVNRKTKRLIIEVSIPDNGRNTEGVVDVLVGHKLKSRKRFVRPTR